jgi:hypothetical protein
MWRVGAHVRNPEVSNGTYTQALSRFMQQEGLGIEDVFKYVRAEVVRETSSQQRPWESSSMMPGAFYFKGKAAAVAECPQGSEGASQISPGWVTGG